MVSYRTGPQAVVLDRFHCICIACIEYMSIIGTLNVRAALCIHVTVLRTNSCLVVPLLLALHSTTRAMTPPMAAVSNTPPMKPPATALAQPSTGN